jgi:hypothetical protein
VLDLEDLGASRPEGVAHQVGGFVKDAVQVLATQCEFAEIGQYLLPLQELLAIRHGIL